MEEDFIVCDFFNENDVLHCASLVITPNLDEDERGRLDFSQPTDNISNGTITFVKHGGKTYGITCWHIIEIFRDKEVEHGQYSHSMRTMLNGFYIVQDRFFRPSADFGQPQPDVAIRELAPEFIKKIEKEPIDIDILPVQPDKLKYAIAIGFPSALKYKKNEENGFGYRVSMPHVSIVAELTAGKPNQRFSLFSQLEDKPETSDYSGASGGPIYWSTENEFGILGIIYESAAGTALLGDQSIHISGELATPEIIKTWISEYHARIA